MQSTPHSPLVQPEKSQPRSSRTAWNDATGPTRETAGEMSVEDVNEFWFWATNDGALKTVDRKELVSSLNRGDIPPKAFVWRQGWAEWVRAAQVAELSSALAPAARLSPVMPKLSPDATHPPPVPRADKIALEPIVPVASTPENDKPGTQLLVEDELSMTDLEPVEEPPASKAPPPPRRPASSRPAPPRPGSVQGSPIIPVDSTPENDRPKTASMKSAAGSPSAKKLEDSAPPSGKWVEVSSPTPARRSRPRASPKISWSPSSRSTPHPGTILPRASWTPPRSSSWTSP